MMIASENLKSMANGQGSPLSQSGSDRSIYVDLDQDSTDNKLLVLLLLVRLLNCD